MEKDEETKNEKLHDFVRLQLRENSNFRLLMSHFATESNKENFNDVQIKTNGK